ncbi:MAG TPA: hypothetical protein H9858_07435 [Candidatus Blautia stercoravium]|nr:hypothetical protein [Candidatus Blautia stercoravium]
MLKKLFKYDWKSVSLLLLILHGILLFYTLIGRISISIAMSQNASHVLTEDSVQFFGIVGALYILGFFLFIFAIMVATFVYLASRMQKSLFSDEGYLTHTLPVSPGKLLFSKMLVFCTWSVLDILCVILSILILVTYKDSLLWMVNELKSLLDVLSGFTGIEEQTLMILTILDGLVRFFAYYTTLLFFALCLGSLFKTHKILGAIVSFFGINIGLSVVQTLLCFLIPGLNPFSIIVSSGSADGSVITQASLGGNKLALMGFSLAWDLVFAILFFLSSRYILSKKLNLQ